VKAAAVINGTAPPVARWARVPRRYEWQQSARRTEAERKRQAVAMVRDGHTYTTVGAAVGADRRTIARWVQQADRDQLELAA
jgi:transposase-like protein